MKLEFRIHRLKEALTSFVLLLEKIMKDAREDSFSNFKKSIDEQKSSDEEKQSIDSSNSDREKLIMKNERKKQEIKKERKQLEKRRKSSNEKMSLSTNQSKDFR